MPGFSGLGDTLIEFFFRLTWFLMVVRACSPADRISTYSAAGSKGISDTFEKDSHGESANE